MRKAQRPRACNFIQKEILVQLLFCKFCEIFKNIFLIEHLLTLNKFPVKQVNVSRELGYCRTSIMKQPLGEIVNEKINSNLCINLYQRCLTGSYYPKVRRCHRRCSIKNDFLNFSKFTGNYLCQSLCKAKACFTPLQT